MTQLRRYKYQIQNAQTELNYSIQPIEFATSALNLLTYCYISSINTHARNV